MNAAGILSAVVGPLYINLHLKCELSCSNDFRDKYEIVELMVEALRSPMQYTG